MPIIRSLNDEYSKIVQDYTAQHELEYAFFIENINCYGLENDHKTGRAGDYYACFDDGSVVSSMAYYNLGGLIYYSKNQDAHRLNADIIKERGYKPRVYMGMSNAVLPLLKELNDQNGAYIVKDSYYMVLNKQRFNPVHANYEIKGIKECQKDEVLDLLAEEAAYLPASSTEEKAMPSWSCQSYAKIY